MNIVEITADGKQKHREAQRFEITHEFQMYSRDLRPVFSIKQLSTISQKGTGILLNIGEVKVIIGKESAIIFHGGKPEILEEMIPKMLQVLQDDGRKASFELRMFECALNFSLEMLQREFKKIERSAQKILIRLRKTISDEYFEMLLNTKKHLNKLQISVREAEEAAEEVLKDEEEIELLCLGKNQQKEMESVIEHAWEQFEDLSHRIHELDEHVDDTQDFITLKMANRRNLIIRFDLIISILTAILSGFAVVTGIFGMNLRSTFENSNTAFVLVILGIIFGAFFLILLSFWYLRKKKIW